MIRKFNFDYDYDNDSLFIFDPKSKSKASVSLIDMIIDYNSKKEISGIELLNASEIFKALCSKNTKLTKQKLKDISGCKVEIVNKSTFTIIKFILEFKSKEQITAPVMIPSIHESCPAAIA